MVCSRSGLSQETNPLSSALKPIPSRRSWHLAYSCSVQTQLGIVRKVRGELEKERTELTVQTIPVIARRLDIELFALFVADDNFLFPALLAYALLRGAVDHLLDTW